MENSRGSLRARPQVAERHLGSEIGAILVFGLSVFALFALITYHPSDPSFFSNVSGAVQNACGRVGALMSSVMLQFFGLGAFLVPCAFFLLSATVHKREGSVRLFGTMGGMAVAVMALAVFLTLQWKYWPYAGSLLLTGGAVGVWFAEALIRQFNPLGSSIVSLGVFFVALVLSTPISVARHAAAAFRALGYFLKHVVARIAWRSLRLLAVYLFYLLGLFAARTAKAVSEFVQSTLERAVARGKEIETTSRPVNPVVGLDGPPGSSTEKLATNANSDDEERDIIEIASLAQKPAAKPGTLGFPSEAPNALDGFTGAPLGKPATARIASGKAPDILPAQPSNELAMAGSPEGSTPESKVASKLAKAAARARHGHWKLPTAEFLRKAPKIESQIDRDRLIANSRILVEKFADFGIEGEVTAVRPGPVITLYEFKPGPGIKVSRIAALADDLSMALSAQSVRILAPLPGKSVVGIEIPSDQRETVYLREFIEHPDFDASKHTIPIVMGKDIGGQTYLADLARMPHLLCAGQTGAGKSVFMNGLICSLFYRFTPDELRMILVDPKFIEFRAYQDIPHLLLPVVDDPKLAGTALKWAVREMERRYRILAKLGARNLASFNQKVEEMGSEVVRDLLFAEENQDESVSATTKTGNDWIEAFEPDEQGAPRVGKLPYIVVIIDELADLMMIAKKEVEISIARIAQKARAAGIHLVIATQRPSTDVVTGLIKANLPSRVSFQLASFVDSKTILDRAGAERLLGQGDMLFIPPGVSQTLRLHGAFVDDEEIGKITAFWKSQGKPAYRDEILLAADDEDEDGEGADGDDGDDDLFQEGVELVKRSGHASASFLQRHLKIGYNRAARMIETMENRGIVGPADGARPREVLMR